MKRRRLFGQHFMLDKELLDKMVRLLNIGSEDVVFEIGTGRGELTERLANKAKKVITYEIDKELYEEAKKRLSNFKNVKVILGDAFKSRRSFDLLISNLPYSRSSDFINWLAKRKFKRALVTLQKEFVDKLLAKPGDKRYRAISVIAQLAFKITIIEEIRREAFFPPPKISSYLVLIEPKRILKDTNLIKFLFSFRGKKISSVLKKLGKEKELKEERVEKLTPEDFLRIIY